MTVIKPLEFTGICFRFASFFSLASQFFGIPITLLVMRPVRLTGMTRTNAHQPALEPVGLTYMVVLIWWAGQDSNLHSQGG